MMNHRKAADSSSRNKAFHVGKQFATNIPTGKILLNYKTLFYQNILRISSQVTFRCLYIIGFSTGLKLQVNTPKTCLIKIVFNV